MDESNTSLNNADIRKLKAAAQRLKPILKIGKVGLTPAFLNSVHDAFTAHELIKIKFDNFKDQKKTLAPQLAKETKSHLVTLIGNVAVLYRLKPATESSGSAPENS